MSGPDTDGFGVLSEVSALGPAVGRRDSQCNLTKFIWIDVELLSHQENRHSGSDRFTGLPEVSLD